jgi:hypothetical protein
MMARAEHRGGSKLTEFAPDINSGKVWSKMDLDDLEACSECGNSVAEAASFLCRSKEETKAKAAELGIQLPWLNAEQRQRAAERYRAPRSMAV